MRSKRLASHSKSKPSSPSSFASHDSPPATTADGPRSHPQTPSSSKPLQMPDATPAAAASAVPAATSRRSERKRKPREFGERSASAIRHKKVWSESDEVALLEGALAFRSSTGALPKQSTVVPFFATIKNSVGSQLTPEQAGYKLKRLKAKFMRSASAGSSAGATAHDRRVSELSSEIWCEEAKQAHGVAEEEEVNGDVPTAADAEEEEEEEEEDYGEKDNYPFIREAVVEYWKMNGPCPSRVLLQKGLKLIDPSKGRDLEEKLRKQSEAEMETWMKRLDLLKEISKLLSEAHKGSSL